MESTNIKLFDSELKVMEILWRDGDTTAKSIAQILAQQISWSKTTTYTVIKKCIDKKSIHRIEPGFICHALISKEQAREYEMTELINKLYDGAADSLVASIIGGKNLTSEEIERLKQMINELE